MTQRKDSDKTRYQQALDILLVAQKESDKLIQDVKMAIAEHDAKGDLLKQYAASAKVAGMKATNDAASNLDHTDKGQDGPAERIDENVDELRLSASEKGKGKAPERIQNTPWSEDIDSQDDDLPHNPAGDEHRVKRRALQQRLRECYITHHRVVFLFVLLRSSSVYALIDSPCIIVSAMFTICWALHVSMMRELLTQLPTM